MTREKALELSNILKAYSEGKIIQIYIDGIVENRGYVKGWQDIKNFDIDYFNKNDFFKQLSSYDDSFKMNGSLRIKPELKLVPFTLEDSNLLLGKIIKGKGIQTSNTLKQLITSCSEMFVWTGSISQGKRYKELLSHYVFEDGTPCGKYVEE